MKILSHSLQPEDQFQLIQQTIFEMEQEGIHIYLISMEDFIQKIIFKVTNLRISPSTLYSE